MKLSPSSYSNWAVNEPRRDADLNGLVRVKSQCAFLRQGVRFDSDKDINNLDEQNATDFLKKYLIPSTISTRIGRDFSPALQSGLGLANLTLTQAGKWATLDCSGGEPRYDDSPQSVLSDPFGPYSQTRRRALEKAVPLFSGDSASNPDAKLPFFC